MFGQKEWYGGNNDVKTVLPVCELGEKYLIKMKLDGRKQACIETEIYVISAVFRASLG